jgi:hypothetical protein
MNLNKGHLAKCPEESGHSAPKRSRADRSSTTLSSADEISKSLTQQGAKVPKAPKTPFWHFCHCLTLGISRYARRARVWSPSWWRLSVPDVRSLCQDSCRRLQYCIQTSASLSTPPRCCAKRRSTVEALSWNRGGWVLSYPGSCIRISEHVSTSRHFGE